MFENINYRFLGSIALVILAGVLAILYFTNKDTMGDRLFGQYFEAYRPETGFGESQPKKNSFHQAMIYYQNLDYDSSSKILKTICDSDSAKAIHHFYLGNSLLALDKPKPGQAKAAFREVFAFKAGFTEQAQWYFGLACLKNREEDAARNMLWEIARKENGFKKAEARKIVDKLLEG